MHLQDQYIAVMNRSLRQLLIRALGIVVFNPSLAFFIGRAILSQRKAALLRELNEQIGLHVPPFMIASITKSCNLHCKGCYAQVHHQSKDSDMNVEKLESILREAGALGISICLLAGGEPLTRKDIFSVTKQFPNMLFPLFTNGLLIDEAVISEFKRQKNVLPVISVEGFEKETDLRRGFGVYSQLQKTFVKLKKKSIFWGASITVTSENFNSVTAPGFIQNLTGNGCKLFFYVEYVPVEEGTDSLVLSGSQQKELLRILEERRKSNPALFVAFPGDEEALGGCLAAGRGFIHISPDGSLEPCPFAPYSDSNLHDMPLREALNSKFMRTIRENHSELMETKGGCALWQKRDWVRSLLG